MQGGGALGEAGLGAAFPDRVRQRRQVPHHVVARHGHEQRVPVGREGRAVGARAIGRQAADPAVGAQPVHPLGAVLRPGLAMIGEV